MLIPFIIEPSYGGSVWTPAIRAGIDSELSRKKYSSVYIEPSKLDSIDKKIFASGMAAVIGTSPSFMPNMISELSKRNIGVLSVCYQPPENLKVRGIVRIDYVSGMYSLLELLLSCRSRHPALYGCFPDSSTDMIKRRAYLEYASAVGFEPIMIDNSVGLVSCFNELRAKLDCVDSLICVNDIAAVSALRRLNEIGVKVPDDLQIVSFGANELARLCKPSITAIEMANFELGRQVVNAFSYLTKNTNDVTMSVRVNGDLMIGGSTKPISSKKEQLEMLVGSGSSFYDDDEVKNIECIEHLLSVCDELDRKMLRKMLLGNSSEMIAEELSLASETVRYRMRRMLSAVGFDSRTKLLTFIRENGFEKIF